MPPMRLRTAVLALAALPVAACSSTPSMSTADRQVCSAQAGDLAQLRSATDGLTADADTVLIPTQDGGAALTRWVDEASSPDLKGLLTASANATSDVNAEARASLGVVQVWHTLKKEQSTLSALASWCHLP